MNDFRLRISVPLLTALLCGAAFAAPANLPPSPREIASAEEESSPVQLERYVVTGSNIPMAADALAAPVSVLGPQQIAETGVFTNALDVLRKAMPHFSGNLNIGSENADVYSGSTMGGSALSLHNARTLVLLNGRRVAFSPAAAQDGAQFVDVNLIPLAAIQRIEALTDGASAIYGSDAVSGVVNVILKSRFEGFEVGGHYGMTDNDGHYAERSAYVTGGASNGRTSIMLAAQYSREDPVFLYERPFSANQTGLTTYFPGVIDVYDFATGENPFYMLRDDLDAPPGGGGYTIEQLVADGVYVPVSEAEASAAFNLSRAVTMYMAQKRRSVVAALDHEIAGDRLSAFGDFVYANTFSQSQLNGPPLFPFISTPYLDFGFFGQTPPPPAGFGTGYLLADRPSSPLSPEWIDQGAPADYSAGKLVFVHNRFTEHPRVFQHDSTLLRGVAGLRGTFAEDYGWEIAANLNRISLDYRNPGLIDVDVLTDALNSGAVNPFARTQAEGVLPGALIGTAQARLLSRLNAFDAKVTGPVLALPAGRVAFAVGAQLRRESLSAEPDPLSIPDENGNIGWVGATSLSPFDASRRISAAFLELQVPVVAPAAGVRGVHRLDLNIAGRLEHYSDVGTSEVPKFSVRYQPFDAQLTLRATAGQSFSAPQLYYVYGPTSQGFTDNLTFERLDGSTRSGVQFQVLRGSNPDLEPAKAHTWTAGFVYSPRQVNGLSLALDFYGIDETGLLGSYDEQVVVQDVELRGADSPYASHVHFGGWSGPTISAAGQLGTAASANVYLNLPTINLAGQKVRGIDASLTYAIDTNQAGRFELSSTLVAYTSYRVQALPTEPYYQYAGYATGGGSGSNGTIPRWRTYTTLDWALGAWRVMLANTYIPSVDDIGPGGSAARPSVRVDSFATFDLAASCRINTTWLHEMKVTLGVANLFNEKPPKAAMAFPDASVDLGTYGGIGRLFYISANYTF